MKVLFIGPYRQNDGWSEASRALINSILTIKEIDLTLRPIFLAGNREITLEDHFTPLENKINEHYDVIIQHSLPEFFHWHEGSKNIGFCLSETNHLEFTPWISAMNLMDEIWVSSTVELKSLKNSLCTTPIIIMGEATDTNKFLKSYVHNVDNFTFYTIGEGERKNFNALLMAFHREFDRNEPVDLLIKSSNLSVDALNQLKAQFGIYKNLEQYKQEKLVLNRLSEHDLNQMHMDCNCFVMTSYGEAWCRPALDALGFGKTPIVTDNTGTTDFIDNNNGWVVKSYETPCLVQNKPLEYLYTSRETWFSIDILELQKAMREAYTNRQLKNKKAAQGIKDINKYSYQNRGKIIRQRLLGDQ